MNQGDPADGPATSAYEDEFSDEFDGAEGAADEMAAGEDYASADGAGEESFAGEDQLESDAWDNAEDLSFEERGDDGFAAGNWQAFEADVADALDEGDGDAFLRRILGGLSNVARRGLAPAARRAAAAGGARPLDLAARALAQRLAGASSAWAQRPAAPPAAGLGGAAPGIAALLSRLMAQGADDYESFDEVADAYEDGVDEALPAIVGLAARGLARGLGHRTVGQLGQAARQALVRGVATAARTLVHQHGPRGARALGRIAPIAGRAAARGAASAQHAAQRVARSLPRVAQRVARQGAALGRLARPLAQGRPAGTTRGAGPRMGTAGPGAPAAGEHHRRSRTRVLRFRGPVEIVIRQR